MIRASCGAKGSTKRPVEAALSGGRRWSASSTGRITHSSGRVVGVAKTGPHLRCLVNGQQRHRLHTTTSTGIGSTTATARQHAFASSSNVSTHHHHRQANNVMGGGGGEAGGATINRINGRTNILECKLSEGMLYMGYSTACTPEVPGNGGLRIGKYSSPGAAQEEAVALTEAMSAKHAMYDTGFNGAKLVFDSDVAIPDLCKDTLMKEVATSLGAMNGAVYTGCDMNTTHKVRRRGGERTQQESFLCARWTVLIDCTAAAVDLRSNVFRLLRPSH